MAGHASAECHRSWIVVSSLRGHINQLQRRSERKMSLIGQWTPVTTGLRNTADYDYIFL